MVRAIERGTQHNINPEMREQLRLVKELGDNYPFVNTSLQQSIMEWC